MKLLDRVLQSWRMRMALRYVPAQSSVCDVGTYDGRLFAIAKRRHVTGVGIDPELQAVLPSIKGVEFRRGIISEVLLPSEQFDVFTALAVLEHIPVEAMTHELMAVWKHLKPDGRLVITLPSPSVDSLLRVLTALRLVEGQMLHQHYGLSLETAEKVVCSAGFFVVERRAFQMGLNTVVVFQKRIDWAEETVSVV